MTQKLNVACMKLSPNTSQGANHRGETGGVGLVGERMDATCLFRRKKEQKKEAEEEGEG